MLNPAYNYEYNQYKANNKYIQYNMEYNAVLSARYYMYNGTTNQQNFDLVMSTNSLKFE